jgi:putative ABC transport system ATP-binding protein
MTDTLVEVTHLRKTFQMGTSEVHALAGVDMEVANNSFTLVMGPSGSGKSTLMYLVGGLDRPTSGEIRVGGKEINQLDENELAKFRHQTVGFVFQSFNLIPNMNALQNVIFPMRFGKIARRQREARARQLLERIGLSDRLYHRPSELSGGQQQRVAIARALVNEPALILADEPTGNLDTASGAGIMRLLFELHQSGRTILVVSHDPRMQAYATHKVFLLDGKIVSEEAYQKASLEILELENQSEEKST